MGPPVVREMTCASAAQRGFSLTAEGCVGEDINAREEDPGLRYVSRQHFEDAGIVQPLETWNSLPPGRFPSPLYGRPIPGEVP